MSWQSPGPCDPSSPAVLPAWPYVPGSSKNSLLYSHSKSVTYLLSLLHFTEEEVEEKRLTSFLKIIRLVGGIMGHVLRRRELTAKKKMKRCCYGYKNKHSIVCLCNTVICSYSLLPGLDINYQPVKKYHHGFQRGFLILALHQKKCFVVLIHCIVSIFTSSNTEMILVIYPYTRCLMPLKEENI